MDPEPDPVASREDDEVARQRRKRRGALLGRSVPGCPKMTMGDLAEQARGDSPATAGTEGVRRFLAEKGHSRGTIAAVLDCLDLPRPGSTGTPAAVAALPVAFAHRRRLRTLAQLEAILTGE